ncbi:hypothetical protein [Kribbella sp. CA-294648]|uniref:hypothetical protein n=1 Tax=Kribbella sp. CA-294648 TaxID=3239948 RepID=UPI003D8BF405
MDELEVADAYRLPPYVFATITPDGAMLLDSRRRGKWFAVNPAGARLLRALLDGANLHLAAQSVANHYRAQHTSVWIDMARLTADLCDRGLLLKPSSGVRKW